MSATLRLWRSYGRVRKNLGDGDCWRQFFGKYFQLKTRTVNKKHNTEYESRFTSPNDIVRKVDSLKTVDLSAITDLELSKLINSYFNIIPFTSGKVPAGTELFRARVNSNKEPFDLVSDIYVPPSHLIKKYGRANKPGERIFYCASNFKLAAFEVIQDLKYSFNPSREVAFLTIGIWKTKVDLHLACILDDPKIHKLRQDIHDSFQANQKILFNGNIGTDTAISNNILLKYFAEEFTKSEIRGDFDYRVSNFYISSLRQANGFVAPRYSSEKFDGVNYPSVAMKYKGDNQALLIESADRKLEFVNAIQVICANLDFENGDFMPGILHEAETIKDGRITWKKEIYRPS